MKSKRSMFAGWFEVFKFTFHQISKGKGFKIATFGITALFFVICFGINVGIALFNDEDTQISNLEKVYVFNETDLTSIDFTNDQLFSGTKFESVAFENTDKEDCDIGDFEAFLHITKTQAEYHVDLKIKDTGSIGEQEGEEFLAQLQTYLESAKYKNSGISQDKLSIILSPVNSVVSEVGEAEQSIGEIVVKTVFPMLLSFVFYFMLLYYGQSIGKTIIAERSSKLMELLLVSVRPYAIVTGKILSTAIIAIMQIILWIFGGIIGFVIGDKVATTISSSYHNVVFDVIHLIQNDSNAFSTSVISIAIIAVCIGFFFYSVLAGLIYSNIKRTEELSSGTSIYVIFIVIGFFSSYFLSAFHSGSTDVVLNILRYIPITSPFILPADLIVGNISILGGVFSLLITLICTILLILLTGRQYKKTLFSS